MPTIWADLLRYGEQNKEIDLSSALRVVIFGGSAVPARADGAFEERHGMRIVHAWGMTETSPLGTVAVPPVAAVDGEEHGRYARDAGPADRCVELPIVDPAAPRCLGRRGCRRDRGEGAVDHRLVLRRRRPRQVRRRMAAHRRRRLARRPTATCRSPTAQGRDQVGRRVDLVGRPRERADGAPRVRRGQRGGRSRRSVGRAPAGLRRASRRGSVTGRSSCATSSPTRWRSGSCRSGGRSSTRCPKTSVGKFDKKVLRQRYADGALEVTTVE